MLRRTTDLYRIIAALGWGMKDRSRLWYILIDYEIGITIRQCTSDFPTCLFWFDFASLPGDIGATPHLTVQFSSGTAMMLFRDQRILRLVCIQSPWYKETACAARLSVWRVTGIFLHKDRSSVDYPRRHLECGNGHFRRSSGRRF